QGCCARAEHLILFLSGERLMRHPRLGTLVLVRLLLSASSLALIVALGVATYSPVLAQGDPPTATPHTIFATPEPTAAPPEPESPPAGAPSAPAQEQVLVEALVGEIRKLNPLLATYNPVDRDITALIFEGLTATNAYGEIVPRLAESW